MPLAQQARIAGVCYFLVVAGGVFAALFVRESFFVSGDVAATARNIAANEALWRWTADRFLRSVGTEVNAWT